MILYYVQDLVIKNLNYHVLVTYLDLFTAENNLFLDEEEVLFEKHSYLIFYSLILPFIELNEPKSPSERVCFLSLSIQGQRETAVC